MMATDKHLAIEKIGKVWRATFDGVTICACSTKRATEANAEYLMNNMHPQTWRALVTKQSEAAN